MLGAEGDGFPLLPAGVQLDLIHHGLDRTLQQGLEVVGLEVRNADGPHAAALVQLRHGPPGLPVDVLPIFILVRIGGPVDEVEV